MDNLYEMHRVGDKRTVWCRMAPGQYSIIGGKGQVAVFKRKALMKITEEWVGDDWKPVETHWDSAVPYPSWWRRLASWLGLHNNLPRAVARYRGTP